MRSHGSFILLASLVALIIPSSIATPHPVTYCKQHCSPKQIYNAFNSPAHLSDTKEFCRRFLNIPDVVVKKTKNVLVTEFHTVTRTKTSIERPITLTSTNVKVTTSTKTQTSTFTHVDVSTVSVTSTIPATTTTSITQTTEINGTVDVLATTTTTTTTTSLLPSTTTTTTTVTSTGSPTLGAGKRDIAFRHVVRRGGNFYGYAFKLPHYLPQDLTPKDIVSACKKINPRASTRTTTVKKTITIYAPKVVSTVVKTTPTVVTTTMKTQTMPAIVMVTKTTSSTSSSTIFETVTSAASTVTKTVTETKTTGTVSITTGTTSTILVDVETSTQTFTETFTTTTVVRCNPIGAPCFSRYPEMCCSGRCGEFNCCNPPGQPCVANVDCCSSNCISGECQLTVE